MEKIKKILVFLIILLLILLLIIAIINKKNNIANNVEYNRVKDQQGDSIVKSDKKVLKNATLFCTVEDCVNTYLDKIKENNIEAVMNILNQKYKKEKNITKDNIKSYINEIRQEQKFIATKINQEIDDNIYTFYVEGILNDNYNNNMYLMVEFDENKLTFNIMPFLENKYNNLDKIESALINTDIEENENNKYSYNRIKDNELSKKYFTYYKNLILNNPQKAYEILDDEYKEKKFNNFNEFYNYIEVNRDKYLKMEIKKYAKYDYEDFSQYVCVDNNGDYYIFNETATMQFKVLLDTYTVDQQEFIKKYDSASDNEKAGYDINKFFEAINAKDYKYAYNCLAESFKQNNFTTQNQFENYIKNNFYNKNDIKYSNYRKEGNYYIYTVNIINSEDTTKSVQKDFIVNLKENRQFEMSFSVE